MRAHGVRLVRLLGKTPESALPRAHGIQPDHAPRPGHAGRVVAAVVVLAGDASPDPRGHGRPPARRAPVSPPVCPSRRGSSRCPSERRSCGRVDRARQDAPPPSGRPRPVSGSGESRGTSAVTVPFNVPGLLIGVDSPATRPPRGRPAVPLARNRQGRRPAPTGEEQGCSMQGALRVPPVCRNMSAGAVEGRWRGGAAAVPRAPSTTGGHCTRHGTAWRRGRHGAGRRTAVPALLPAEDRGRAGRWFGMDGERVIEAEAPRFHPSCHGKGKRQRQEERNK